MRKPTLAPIPEEVSKVLANPLIKHFNEYKGDFIVTHRLSSEQNRYREKYAIEIDAATTFENGLSNIKEVAAYGMMMYDFMAGRYKGKKILVVPTSGNTGLGVVKYAPAFGMEVVVVMNADTPEAKKDIIRAYPWARVICPPPGGSVQEMAVAEASKPGGILLDQYKHIGNMIAHEEITGPAWMRALGDDAPAWRIAVIAMGSGGTPAGAGFFIKRLRPDIIVLGVRPKPGDKIEGVRDIYRGRELEINGCPLITVPFEFVPDAIIEVGSIEAYTTGVELRKKGFHFGPSSFMAFEGLKQYLDGLSPDELEILRGGVATFLCADKDTLYDWSAWE